MTVEEENAGLRAENQALREALGPTQELLGVALARIEELEKLKTPAPAFVKANVKKPEKAEKKARKKRDAKQNRARLMFLRILFAFQSQNFSSGFLQVA